MNRRMFFQATAGTAVAGLFPAIAQASSPPPRGLWLLDEGTKSWIEVLFIREGEACHHGSPPQCVRIFHFLSPLDMAVSGVCFNGREYRFFSDQTNRKLPKNWLGYVCVEETSGQILAMEYRVYLM